MELLVLNTEKQERRRPTTGGTGTLSLTHKVCSHHKANEHSPHRGNEHPPVIRRRPSLGLGSKQPIIHTLGLRSKQPIIHTSDQPVIHTSDLVQHPRMEFLLQEV